MGLPWCPPIFLCHSVARASVRLLQIYYRVEDDTLLTSFSPALFLSFRSSVLYRLTLPLEALHFNNAFYMRQCFYS
uniref:Putative secreted protein n=1 Tax=Anopheles marajoara TaxID=58244 RepID=A0A2M4CCS3_9DIPT